MGILDAASKASIATGAIGSGIQFGLNAVSDLVNQAFAKRNADIQAKYNKELMQYQQQLQQESIDKQNVYNTPAMEMQRYAEAGLNPNLIYGNTSGGNQTSVPKPTAQAPANFQNTSSPYEHMLQGVNMLESMIRVQKSINETKESAARAKMMENQAFLTDVNTRIGRWKYNNMLPLYLDEQQKRNIGLGYDNEINRWRARYAEDNELSKSILYQSQSDISYNQYLKELAEYSNWSYWNQKRKEMFGIDYLHKKQAYYNMIGQNHIMRLQYQGQKLQNEWDKWYNQYRTKYGKNLYTPHLPFEHWGNQVERRLNNDKYLDYGF